MSKQLGPEVIMRKFVDSDYVGDGANRRSRTGFFVFLNGACMVLSKPKIYSSHRNSPQIWFFEHQLQVISPHKFSIFMIKTQLICTTTRIFAHKARFARCTQGAVVPVLPCTCYLVAILTLVALALFSQKKSNSELSWEKVVT